MNSPASSFLLNSFLFHLRTPLFSIRSASQFARYMPGKIPISVSNWLEKWEPDVERWMAAEEKAHSYKRDGEAYDWKQIVYEMAEKMKNVSVTYAEGQTLEMPESPEGEMIISLALEGGFKYLNGIIQPILKRDFEHLLNQ